MIAGSTCNRSGTSSVCGLAPVPEAQVTVITALNAVGSTNLAYCSVILTYPGDDLVDGCVGVGGEAGGVGAFVPGARSDERGLGAGGEQQGGAAW
jgi:hypothetical protein